MHQQEQVTSEEVDRIHFRFYNEEDIKRISVKKITKPDRLDAKNCPVPGGLLDPAMGPINDTDTCRSCGELSGLCPGHFGHIEFSKPLFNPLLFKSLLNLLRVTCFSCHNFRLKREQVDKYAHELELLARGDVAHAKNLEDGKKVPISDDDDEFTESSSVDKSSQSERESKIWTSIQLKEALSIFSKIMKKRQNKCANCDMKSPTITSPTFGQLMKGTNASAARKSIIADFQLKGDGHVDDSNENGVSGLDEELPSSRTLPEGSSNQTRYRFDDASGEKHLLTTEVESILRDLWKNEARFCMLLCDFQQNLSVSEKRRDYEMFFLKSLLVAPNRFRPSTSSSLGIMEHPQNVLLSKVQEANLALQHANANHNHVDILRRWMDLQTFVNVLYDSSTGLVKSEKDACGIRQLLDGKEGLLRQKMMGKRVNYACRSVISPDPYLAVNEIGIPPVFATRLTYPEKVTPWNAKKLQEAVNNGPDINPGATYYKDNNNIYKLQCAPSKRRAIARMLPASRGSIPQPGKDPRCEFERKVVCRHLQDGDIVLVNRQPTLHKPSMMAHFVRLLPGEKTIRMHYSNCSTYNADFDGDEINVHFPQDEISRAEAINIVDANKQYIGPKSGDAARGLLQDHIVSAVLLTKLDTFLSREEYSQLVYGSCMASTRSSCQSSKKVSIMKDDDGLDLVPPAIWKPKPLWTGKQVITTILNHLTKGHPPFTVEQKGKISKEYLTPKNCHGAKDNARDPSELYIHDNELIKGMIDKAQFSKYGMVHTVHELYGADIAGILLSAFSRLFTLFLQLHGFTCGVDDLLLCQESDQQRTEILGTSEKCSEKVHRKFTCARDGDEDPVKLLMEVEQVVQRNGESATLSLDIMMCNALKEITSKVNQSLFLQKPFPQNCLSLMTATGAKGSMVNMAQISSLLGQQELEGKRVPRMVSGKTLPCFPPWDTSSRAGGFIADRFLTGLRPQEYYFHCMAGREGLVDTAVKTSCSGYIQRCLVKSLESLIISYDHTVRDVDGSIIQFCYGEDGVDVLKSTFLDRFKELADNRKAVLDKLGSHKGDHLLSTSNGYITKLPEELINRAMEFLKLSKDEKRCRYNIKKKELMKILEVKYLASLVDPGEAVGVIAAQSIGEPATQMTLNTFHLAGRGDMNVTLGIPRLTEILITASRKISTPFMKCPLHEDRTRDDAERVAAKLRRVCVADILEGIEVCTVPFHNHNGHVSTLYKLKMKLYPQEHYPPGLELTVHDSLTTLRKVFVDAMEDAIEKHIDFLHKINGIQTTKVEHTDTGSLLSGGLKESISRPNGGDDAVVSDGDDENEDDLGTDAEKRKRRENDETEYDDDILKQEGMDCESEEETKYELENEDDPVDSGGESEVTEEGHVSDSNKVGRLKLGLTACKLQKERRLETVDGNLEGQKAQISQKHRKKLKWTVHVESTDLNFEVHYVLHEEPHILLAQIAEKTARSVCVKKCNNISRCIVVEEGSLDLQTAGVNFEAFWNLEDYLDIRKIRSNDIHAMLKTYGVEAARATILQEVRGVFRSYGIDVNMRHLCMTADFITFDGGYRPISRLGMGQLCTSPFGKMTFETATKFIVDAASRGESDTLDCPSASVSLGKRVKMGTGCFGLLQNIGFGGAPGSVIRASTKLIDSCEISNKHD